MSDLSPPNARARSRARAREKVVEKVLRMPPRKGVHWKDRLSADERALLAEEVREQCRRLQSADGAAE